MRLNYNESDIIEFNNLITINTPEILYILLTIPILIFVLISIYFVIKKPEELSKASKKADKASPKINPEGVSILTIFYALRNIKKKNKFLYLIGIISVIGVVIATVYVTLAIYHFNLL